MTHPDTYTHIESERGKTCTHHNTLPDRTHVDPCGATHEDTHSRMSHKARDGISTLQKVWCERMVVSVVIAYIMSEVSLPYPMHSNTLFSFSTSTCVGAGFEDIQVLQLRSSGVVVLHFKVSCTCKRRLVPITSFLYVPTLEGYNIDV